ncbi:MAG: hypothetical protein HYX25_04480 [Candidatus Solibacter usitatus]|nr:hypothetical protein [Candidatus Solibacter usitatus]
MNYAAALLALLLVPASGISDTRITEVGKDRFEADFASGGSLRIKVRPAGVRIFGGDDNKILVRYEGDNADQVKNVKVRLETTGTRGELEVSGGPRSEFRILIQIPRTTSVHVRVPAGDLAVEGIVGDKDVELNAGGLVLQAGDPLQYASVEASVTAGGLNAGRFDVAKGGLFRSFKRLGPGRYRLHAHVGAGDLTLK